MTTKNPPDRQDALPCSRGVSFITLVAALRASKRIIGHDPRWRPLNKSQREFLEEYYWVDSVGIDQLPGVESLASFSAGYLNAFLAKRGFPELKTPEIAYPDFGLASVYHQTRLWQEPGQEETVWNADTEYPAVFLKGPQLRFYSMPLLDGPVVAIDTDVGDIIFLTVAGLPQDPFDVQRMIAHIERDMRGETEWGSVKFPMVDVQATDTVDWLQHLAYEQYKVASTTQCLRFKMNAQGSRQSDGAVIRAVASGLKVRRKCLVIERPFIAWVRTQSVQQPLGIYYLPPHCWMNPGVLTVV